MEIVKHSFKMQIHLNIIKSIVNFNYDLFHSLLFKLIVFSSIFILNSNFVKCQVSNNEMIIYGNRYPKISIEKICELLILNSIEWENEMKTYDFTARRISKNCIYYVTEDLKNFNMFSITRCPGYYMEVMWVDYSKNHSYQFDDIFNALEPYFSDYRDDGSVEYKLTYKETKYVFTILRETKGNIVSETISGMKVISRK